MKKIYEPCLLCYYYLMKYGSGEMNEIDLLAAVEPHFDMSVEDLLFYRENRHELNPSELRMWV
jgi:hypothetical protein